MHVVQERLTAQNGAVVQQSSSDAVYLPALALNSKKIKKHTRGGGTPEFADYGAKPFNEAATRFRNV